MVVVELLDGPEHVTADADGVGHEGAHVHSGGVGHGLVDHVLGNEPDGLGDHAGLDLHHTERARGHVDAESPGLVGDVGVADGHHDVPDSSHAGGQPRRKSEINSGANDHVRTPVQTEISERALETVSKAEIVTVPNLSGLQQRWLVVERDLEIVDACHSVRKID